MTCLSRTFSCAGRLLALAAASVLAVSCGVGGSVTGPDPVPEPSAVAAADEAGAVEASAAKGKVSVCHKQGSVYKSLLIASNALQVHLGHGDRLPVNGSCATPQIDSTQCSSTSPVEPLCPSDIYAQFGLPVVEGIGWSCNSGQQSGFYVVYDSAGFSCASLTPTGETNISLGPAQVDACLATIRASQLYQTAACN
jgi:hypothetical protein